MLLEVMRTAAGLMEVSRSEGRATLGRGMAHKVTRADIKEKMLGIVPVIRLLFIERVTSLFCIKMFPPIVVR